jgi:hypothetical protein
MELLDVVEPLWIVARAEESVNRLFRKSENPRRPPLRPAAGYAGQFI